MSDSTPDTLSAHLYSRGPACLSAGRPLLLAFDSGLGSRLRPDSTPYGLRHPIGIYVRLNSQHPLFVHLYSRGSACLSAGRKTPPSRLRFRARLDTSPRTPSASAALSALGIHVLLGPVHSLGDQPPDRTAKCRRRTRRDSDSSLAATKARLALPDRRLFILLKKKKKKKIRAPRASRSTRL